MLPLLHFLLLTFSPLPLVQVAVVLHNQLYMDNDAVRDQVYVYSCCRCSSSCRGSWCRSSRCVSRPPLLVPLLQPLQLLFLSNPLSTLNRSRSRCSCLTPTAAPSCCGAPR